MKASPTQRSLEHMRKLGYACDVVEKWIPGANIRKDLFGCIDILCLGPEGTVAVQATSGTNVSARVNKIAESEHVGAMRKAGWKLLVHGWIKESNGRYRLREVDVS